jgi:hypothetical protein
MKQAPTPPRAARLIESSAGLHRDEHPRVQREATNLPTDLDHLEVQADVGVAKARGRTRGRHRVGESASWSTNSVDQPVASTDATVGAGLVCCAPLSTAGVCGG